MLFVVCCLYVVVSCVLCLFEAVCGLRLFVVSCCLVFHVDCGLLVCGMCLFFVLCYLMLFVVCCVLLVARWLSFVLACFVWCCVLFVVVCCLLFVVGC